MQLQNLNFRQVYQSISFLFLCVAVIIFDLVRDGIIWLVDNSYYTMLVFYLQVRYFNCNRRYMAWKYRVDIRGLQDELALKQSVITILENRIELLNEYVDYLNDKITDLNIALNLQFIK